MKNQRFVPAPPLVCVEVNSGPRGSRGSAKDSGGCLFIWQLKTTAAQQPLQSELESADLQSMLFWKNIMRPEPRRIDPDGKKKEDIS